MLVRQEQALASAVTALQQGSWGSGDIAARLGALADGQAALAALLEQVQAALAALATTPATGATPTTGEATEVTPFAEELAERLNAVVQVVRQGLTAP